MTLFEFCDSCFFGLANGIMDRPKFRPQQGPLIERRPPYRCKCGAPLCWDCRMLKCEACKKKPEEAPA